MKQLEDAMEDKVDVLKVEAIRQATIINSAYASSGKEVTKETQDDVISLAEKIYNFITK